MSCPKSDRISCALPHTQISHSVTHLLSDFFSGRALKEFFISSENPFFQDKRLRGLSRIKKSPFSTFLTSEENRKHMQVKAHPLGKVYLLSSTANHFLSSLGKGALPATSWSPAVVVREGSIRWKPLGKEW